MGSAVRESAGAGAILLISATLLRLGPAGLILIMWTLVFPAAGSAAEIAEGILSNVSGDIEVQKRGGRTWIRAYDGMRIGPGDQISSGIDGRAVLTIKDSKTDIASLTQFVVGRSVESKDQVYTELFLRLGKVVSTVPKPSEGGGIQRRFNVITPTAVVGVRGTEQAVGYFPGQGTDANIRDGKGFAAPAPDALAGPAKAILGISPARMSADNGKNGGNGQGEDEKEKKKKKKEKGTLSDEGEETDKEEGRFPEEGGAAMELASADEGMAEGVPAQMDPPTTTEIAVEQFNQWLDNFDLSVDPDAGIQSLGLLDDQTLDFVVPVDDGLRITVADREDPGAFVSTVSTQSLDAQSDIAPLGLSPAEQQETATTLETVDQPLSISVTEEQSSLDDAAEIVTQTSTQQGGVPPNVPLIVPPALPDVTGNTNINN